MDPEPYVITGMFLGSIATLIVQFLWNKRKANKLKIAELEARAAQADQRLSPEQNLLLDKQDKMYSAMLRLEERISVVERISTEREGTVGRLSDEIEKLR